MINEHSKNFKGWQQYSQQSIQEMEESTAPGESFSTKIVNTEPTKRKIDMLDYIKFKNFAWQVNQQMINFEKNLKIQMLIKVKCTYSPKVKMK